MEEGLINKPITRNDTKSNAQDDIMGSSVTPLLLFSTFVAISASFTFGCAVSFSLFSLLFHFLLVLILIIFIVIYVDRVFICCSSWNCSRLGSINCSGLSEIVFFYYLFMHFMLKFSLLWYSWELNISCIHVIMKYVTRKSIFEWIIRSGNLHFTYQLTPFLVYNLLVQSWLVLNISKSRCLI